MERSGLGSASALPAKYMDLPNIQVEVNEEGWLVRCCSVPENNYFSKRSKVGCSLQ